MANKKSGKIEEKFHCEKCEIQNRQKVMEKHCSDASEPTFRRAEPSHQCSLLVEEALAHLFREAAARRAVVLAEDAVAHRRDALVAEVAQRARQRREPRAEAPRRRDVHRAILADRGPAGRDRSTTRA